MRGMPESYFLFLHSLMFCDRLRSKDRRLYFVSRGHRYYHTRQYLLLLLSSSLLFVLLHTFLLAPPFKRKGGSGQGGSYLSP